MYYTTDKQTLTIEFLLAPSNRYVGWVVYNNAYYWGSANTLERLEHNVQQSLWKSHGKGLNIRLRLASKPTEREFVPLDKMSNHFKGRAYFAHKMIDTVRKDQRPVFKRTIKKSTVSKFDIAEPVMEEPRKITKTTHFYEVQNGILYVYEKKLIATYEVEDAK